MAALPAEAQAMAKQALQQIEAETNAAKLREGLRAAGAGRRQAPPEMKPALDLILKRGRERLAALESGKK